MTDSMKIFIGCMLLLSGVAAHAQSDSLRDEIKPEKVFAGRLLWGSVFAHSVYIQNTAGAHPRGIEIEISKQLKDEKTWQKYSCYPRMGWTFSYFDLNTPILGKSFSASYFLEPNFKLSNSLAFFINAGGGLSYLTNPHDDVKNPENQTYSLPVNFFLHLGVGVDYRVNNNVSVDLTGGFEHNSNGDFEQPNRGINWPAATFTFRYTPENNFLPVHEKKPDKSWKKEKIQLDAGVFYSPKAGYNLDTTIHRKYLIGATAEASKSISSLSALSVAAEIYYDDAFRSTKDLIRDSSSALLAGLMIGHEFVFRRFIFSQQIGYYIHKESKTFSTVYRPFIDIYHRWGLRYKFTPHIYAGINLMAREDIADFIDLRVLYRL